MKLLVTGGAGYIGSVVAAKLVAAGHEVTVLDDLSTGFTDAVPAGAGFSQGNLREDAKTALGDDTDAVLHFAAYSQVGESVANPAKYWSNNLGGTLALLEAMRVAGTPRIVFSSTAACYGEPEATPIPETAPVRPTSPYGATKTAVDTALAEFARMHGLGAVSLRYFNVAGAFRAADGTWTGERHDPESHLIPTVLRACVPPATGKRDSGDTPAVQALPAQGESAARGGPAPDSPRPQEPPARRPEADSESRLTVRINGTDYPTPDGTCVRDYIHVADLADAHLLALGACEAGRHQVYNLGNGAGFSVREVVDVCREVTGVDIPAETGPRRPGDPAILVASSERIQAELGWQAAHDLRAMVSDAWQFILSRR